MNQVDGIAAISSSDKTAFQNFGITQPIQSIPFGMDIAQSTTNDTQGFFFLGSLDWHANIDGVNWLSEQVASKLSSAVKIAGRNPSPKIKPHDKIVMVGEVNNAKEFMLANGIMLVPLFSGSGIRIKILEAMAWGVPVVATTKAIEGLSVKHQEHCMVADDPDQFTAHANLLFSDANLRKKMIESAREFIKENYDKKNLAMDLQLFYQKIISG
jgi:glycosyltransferase involved in cell wall biosynthesis